MIFKIELVNVKNPKVLRTISIPSVMTFSQMHLAIQIAFGWDNAHLYDFRNQGSKSLSAYPVCIEGSGMCPVEDCGGFPGWDFLKSCIARLKDVGARALDSDSRENLEWAFGSLASARRVNLDRVDIASVNRTLSRVFKGGF